MAAALATALLIVAALYVTPSFTPLYHGLSYLRISRAPFDFGTESALRFRMLGPLIGYVTGLRGLAFVFVPLAFLALFVAAAYLTYRGRDYPPIDALAMTSLLVFSGTAFIPLISPGYTDPLSYFFVFLAFAFPQRTLLCAACFALALLNHESNLVLLPALVLLVASRREAGWRSYVFAAVCLGAATLPLWITRYVVAQHVDVLYTADYYLNRSRLLENLRNILPLIPLGAFLAFKLFWYFPAHVLMRSSSTEHRLLIGAIVGGVTMQLVVAVDVTRLFVLAFPAVLIGAERCRAKWGTLRFRRFTWRLVGYNFLILQYHMTAGGIDPLLPAPLVYLWRIVAG